LLYLYRNEPYYPSSPKKHYENGKKGSVKSSNTTAPISSVKAIEAYIKLWVSGSRKISEEHLAFLKSCENHDEFEQLLRKGRLNP